MFYSTYVPVNINRVNCAIYSAEKVFDKPHLLQAYEFLTGKNTTNGVVRTPEGISFVDEPNIYWSMPEVFLAYEALQVAEKNKFSFFTIKDTNGIPQLFVSKSFSGQRILVNALTSKSILLSNPQYVSKVASMIDKSYSYTYCQELYSVLEAITEGSNRYLDAVLIGAGSKEEYMALNHYTVSHGNIIGYLGVDIIEELETVLSTGESSETFTISDGSIRRNDLSYWPSLLVSQAQTLVNAYHKCIKKKLNYVVIRNSDMEDGLYLSTNGRYLVKAVTLECVPITNTQVRELLYVMMRNDSNPNCDLDWIWRLANKVR